jgi:hypothetical protein
MTFRKVCILILLWGEQTFCAQFYRKYIDDFIAETCGHADWRIDTVSQLCFHFWPSGKDDTKVRKIIHLIWLRYDPCVTGFSKLGASYPALESREYGRRDPSRWPRGTLYPQKLALTSPTSGGRAVGIVRSRTQATEFSLIQGASYRSATNIGLFQYYATNK